MLPPGDMNDTGLSSSELPDKDVLKYYESLQMASALTTKVVGITNECWKLCAEPSGAALKESDKNCLSNCVNNFLEASSHIAKRFTSKLQNAIKND